MVEDQAETARPPSYFPVPKCQHSAGSVVYLSTAPENLFIFSQFSSGFIVKFIGIAVHDYAINILCSFHANDTVSNVITY